MMFYDLEFMPLNLDLIMNFLYVVEVEASSLMHV